MSTRGVNSPAAALGFYGMLALFVATLTLAATDHWVIAGIAFVAMLASWVMYAWAVLRGA